MTIRLIKLAVIYLVIGMTLGIYMGMSHNFHFRGVHAHVNLLGWASLALAALVFHVYPQLAATRLATAWFWLYNLSLPVGMVALALVLSGRMWGGPALTVSQITLWLSGCLFAINVLWNLRSEIASSASANAAALRA